MNACSKKNDPVVTIDDKIKAKTNPSIETSLILFIKIEDMKNERNKIGNIKNFKSDFFK